MPADETYDTPHPSVVKTGHKEHCHNARAPMIDGYFAKDRQWDDMIDVWIDTAVWIDNRMSQPCGQRKGMAPIGCDGCRELRDENATA